jgi:hypothetical protein
MGGVQGIGWEFGNGREIRGAPLGDKMIRKRKEVW